MRVPKQQKQKSQKLHEFRLRSCGRNCQYSLSPSGVGCKLAIQFFKEKKKELQIAMQAGWQLRLTIIRSIGC